MNYSKEEKAVESFMGGMNCAQSVLGAFASDFGLDIELSNRLAMGLGGGMGLQGEVCGAVSGAVMVLGLAFGEADPDPAKAKEITMQKVKAFLSEFKEKNGHLRCRDLIDGVDLTVEADKKRWVDENMKPEICAPAVKTAVEIVERLV
jgi:C_GCAxxG_C_C family probable redox protein